MQKRRKGTVKSCPALVYLSKTTLICRQTMQDLSMIWPPGWQQVIRAMENSSYFESLDAKAKERYREKLSCVGLSIQDDPYLPTNDARFVNDMAPWLATSDSSNGE